MFSNLRSFEWDDKGTAGMSTRKLAHVRIGLGSFENDPEHYSGILAMARANQRFPEKSPPTDLKLVTSGVTATPK